MKEVLETYGRQSAEITERGASHSGLRPAVGQVAINAIGLLNGFIALV